MVGIIPTTTRFDCSKCCAEKQQFEGELVRMIENHRNFPSVIMYVVFNEGWGQYEVGTARALHGHCMCTWPFPA